MHFSSKTFLPLVLTSAIAAAITGCNGGSGGDSQAKDSVDVQSISTFSALYMGQIDHNAERQPSAADAERTPMAVTYFDGTLTAVDAATNTPKAFDWPLVLGADGMVTSQKTVTLEPGTYDFTLVVNRGTQQYTATILQYEVDDQGEYRLDFQLDPIAGDTVVDFNNVKLMSRLQLQFPSDELASIDAPQIGLVVDGVETIYQLNKETGMTDITLNYQGGTHSYDVNLYNADQLIGRSKAGAQSVDLEQGTDFKLEIISLQADVTVDISNLDEPQFIFNIPQEVIDHVGDAANVNLMARITDNETVQEVILPVELVNGKYQAAHTFDAIESGQVAAYMEFLDVTEGGSEVISTCADSINVSEENKLNCEIELHKDYVVGGNLLATLSINVLDQNKVAQSGAQVFVDGDLVGVTGDNFATPGFIKTHVKAGAEHLVKGRKGGLQDTHNLTPGTLSINNFDLILQPLPIDENDILGEGRTCKTILDSGNSLGSGLYRLDIDEEGPLDNFVTYCDMDTKEGGWTLVQNRQFQQPLVTSYNLSGPIVESGSTSRNADYLGAISDDAWNALRAESTELQAYSANQGEAPHYFYTTIETLSGTSKACLSWDSASTLLAPILFHYEVSGCSFGGVDYASIGIGIERNADVDAELSAAWLEHTATFTVNADGTAIYLR